MTTADGISVFRLAATPVVAFCLLRGFALPAAVVFTLAALSDGLDGYLARRQETSRHGAGLDLMADKALVLTTLALLTKTGALTIWVPVLVGGREMAVAGLRAAILWTRGCSLPADRWGKAKMALLCLGISVLLVARIQSGPSLLYPMSQGLLATGTLLALASGMHYGVTARHLLRGGR